MLRNIARVELGTRWCRILPDKVVKMGMQKCKPSGSNPYPAIIFNASILLSAMPFANKVKRGVCAQQIFKVAYKD